MSASPLLAWPGAVEASGPDAGIAWHYGDPLAEQRAAVEESAFVDRSHRGVVRLDGPDRLSWLHTLTSQHLSDLGPGRSTEALLLDPQGHVEHHLQLVDDGDATWIHVEGSTTATLVGFLTRMVFWSQVTVTDVTEEWAVLSLLGSVPDVLGVHFDGRVTDVLVPRAELELVAAGLRDAGVRPAGSWAFEALRIAAVEPRVGIDSDERTIPNEMSWLQTAVHLDKGCYRGQETVARVHNLGRPPRRLVLLQLDGSESAVPEHGAPIAWDGREVGTVGSAALHWEQGPIALALVRRQVPDDAVLDVAGIPGSIDGLTYTVQVQRRERPPLQRF